MTLRLINSAEFPTVFERRGQNETIEPSPALTRLLRVALVPPLHTNPLAREIRLKVFLCSLLLGQESQLSNHLRSTANPEKLARMSEAWDGMLKRAEIHPFEFTRASESTLRRLFVIFLGRPINTNDSITARQKQGYGEVLSRFAKSDEFRSLVTSIVKNETLPHSKAVEVMPHGLLPCVEGLFCLEQMTRQHLSKATSWRIALRALFSDEHVYQVLFSGLDRDHPIHYLRQINAAEAWQESYISEARFDSSGKVVLQLSSMPLISSINVMADNHDVDHALAVVQIESSATRPKYQLNLPEGILSARHIWLRLDVSSLQYLLEVRPTEQQKLRAWRESTRQARMGDVEGSIKLLETIAYRDKTDREISVALARLNLLLGNLGEASMLLAQEGPKGEEVPAYITQLDRNIKQGARDDAPVLEQISLDALAGEKRHIALQAASGGDSYETFVQTTWNSSENPAEVYAALRLAMELEPTKLDDEKLLNRLVKNRLDENHLDSALRTFERLESIGELSLDTIIAGSYLFNRIGTKQAKEKAVDLLRRARKRLPHDEKLLVRSVNIERDLISKDPLWRRESFKEDLYRLSKKYQRALINSPEDPFARFDMARHLILADRLPAAREILESLYQLQPNNRKYPMELLRVFERLGNWGKVKELGSELLQQNPDDPRTLISVVKALRQLHEPELAQALLDSSNWSENGEIAAEYVRNLFFLARFKEVLAQLSPLAERYPGNSMLRVLAIASALETRDYALAESSLDESMEQGALDDMPTELDLFRYAVARVQSQPDTALSALNNIFEVLGCQQLCLAEAENGLIFDNFTATGIYPESQSDYPPLTTGPLVSIVMTSYNAENYLATSINSVLNQAYQNFELIIVDDASFDGTRDIIKEFEGLDARVKGILKTTNDGTYVSKNVGLLQARGVYIALQDSDDWSHPDRIGKSIAVLEYRDDLLGLTTDWLRMSCDGEMIIKAGGQISHVCCISFVFRRNKVLEKAGFFDSVRIEADMEYIRRIGKIFGEDRIVRLRWPLLLGRAHSTSLTAHPEFGLTRTGFTEPRQRYQSSYAEYHARIGNEEDGFMPFPIIERRFEAPEIMLPGMSN